MSKSKESKKNHERMVTDRFEIMCAKSLPPDLFEMSEKIFDAIRNNRNLNARDRD